MAVLYTLGTGAAVSDPHRTTTMLALENERSLVVIDCGGDAVQRLMASGADLGKLSALVVTHEHADHVSGFPLFMEKIWLLGRRDPLPVYGIAAALSQARRMHDTFDTSDWTGYPTIQWNEVAHEEGAVVFSDEHWEVTAAPGVHPVPVVGLRVTDRQGGNTVAYSCDTEPTEPIVRLGTGAAIFVHEATGDGPGHSGAASAARAAAQARAQRLLLVHLPPEDRLNAAAVEKARGLFANTKKAEEGGRYTF